jgi:gliding motility-associated-like protein
MGNGTTFTRNNGTPFTYTYPAVGTYTVKLLVRASTGCRSDTARQTIVVTHVPVPGFELPDVCLNDAFAEFTNTSTIANGTIGQATWQWTFGNPNANAGNPNTSTILNGRHRYTAAQQYQVKLVATSNAGCRDSLTQTLTVNGDKPAAAFNILNPGNICSNLPVRIQNKSTVNFGKVTRLEVFWDWTVNNNDTMQVDDPAFDTILVKQYARFASPASRTVQILVKAYSGTVCVNESLRSFRLEAAPDVRFATIPGICLDALPRTLTQGSDAGGNTGTGIYSGTGVNAAGLFTPSVSGAGTFLLQYKYITTAGCTDSATRNITVWPRPVAAFDIGTLNCINTPVSFTDRSTTVVNRLAQWNWNFGDGNTDNRNSGAVFSRPFAGSQNYTVTLQVVTDSGCTSVPTAQALTIHPRPTVDFDLPTVVCLPVGTASFTNRTTVGGTGGTPIAYNWTFGVPGGSSTLVNPVFNYTATGSYVVRLVATSARGCIDSATKTLTNIVPQALVNFTATPAAVCLGDAIALADRSNPLGNTITEWRWAFGDGRTSGQQNPSVTYSSAGTYTVQLSYLTSTGCLSDTLSREVTVHPYPVVNAGPDQFLLQGGELQLPATVSGSSNYTYLWTPATGLDAADVLQPVTRTTVDVTYTLTVTGAGGCASDDEVFVKVLLKPQIPNAFSPNGDGINDTWTILYLDSYPGSTVQVFDRYGRVVFSSTGYNRPWDGTLSGKPVPAGVYYYIVDPKNQLKPLTGSVTVLR